MHVYNTCACFLNLLFHYTPLPSFSDFRFWWFPCLLFLINISPPCSLWNVFGNYFSKYKAFLYWRKSKEGTYIKLICLDCLLCFVWTILGLKIAGIAASGAVALLAICCLIFCLIYKRQKRKTEVKPEGKRNDASATWMMIMNNQLYLLKYYINI